MIFEEGKSLKRLNTFGFDHYAEYYCEPHTIEDMLEAQHFAKRKKLPVFMLGAGSNIILTKNLSGLTIRQQTDRITYIKTNSATTVSCDAGVNWHDLVLSTLQKNLCGLENLSLIPGYVGAAPIQNIGAYGVELCDVMIQLSALDLNSAEIITFSRHDCRFGYRDSIFKQSQRNRFAILNIDLELNDQFTLNLSYPALADELDKRNISHPTPIDVSRIVADIRKRKLPDPAVIGNAGSFFKNPVISTTLYQDLKAQWPGIPGHSQSDHRYKVPAAWLIETAGWKGKRQGNVGVHTSQALVLVHYGEASGQELLALAESIRSSVQQMFGVELEQEPSVV